MFQSFTPTHNSIYQSFTLYNFQMNDKAENTVEEQNSIRYKIISLFRVNVYHQSSTLSLLQTVLQIFNYMQLLKFVIDYFIFSWLTFQTPLFLYLDLAYYSTLLSLSSFQGLLVFCIIIMNLYWLIQTLLFILGIKYSPVTALIRKGTFLFFRHILFLPFFSILLGIYSCQTNEIFRPCIGVLPVVFQLSYILSFLLFSFFIGAQTYFNFLFLPHPKQYTRLKKSNYTSLLFFGYFIFSQATVFFLNDSAQLAILNLSTLFLLIFLWWRQQEQEQRVKLIQFSGISSLLLGFVIVDFSYLFGSRIQIWVYLLLCVALWGGTLQLRTYSIKFQLDNINKWPTPDIMIRQASTIRYYLSRGNQYMFKIYIHGYMEIHRQKCDNIACPSRVSLSEYDRHLLQTLGYDDNTQQLLRINNILKVIYGAGYRLSPIPPQIQIENCTYQFLRNEYELSLRNLLQVKHQQLSYDAFYVYVQLKEILSNKILSVPHTEFLDLVTQLNLKKRQEELFKLFQRAALINLQFWSLLNDDHPDFQKLNEVGIERMRVDAKVRSEFQVITQWANSQRIVGLYSNYLQCIDNDQQLVMDIQKRLTERYKLKQKLVVHDWTNSSVGTLLISLQQSTFGRIIDLNTSCASFLGYEKHELINQSAKILWPDQLSANVKSLLLSQTNNQNFYICHKSGYLLGISKNARNYNSMQNGLTALLSVKPLLQPFSCYCIIDKNNKILASSASFIPLLSLDLKAYEGQAVASIFFMFSYSTVHTFKETYTKDQFLKLQYSSRGYDKNEAKLRYIIKSQDRYGVKFIEIKRLKNHQSLNKKSRFAEQVANFQFQVEVNTSKLKYFGSPNNSESYVSQFSRLQLENMNVQAKNTVNYAEGISTLRLRQNVVQLIEDSEPADSEQFLHRQESTSNIQEVIPRHDQEQIFSSKSAYQQFLNDYKLGGNLFWVMGLTACIVLVLYIVSYSLYRNNIQSTANLSSQIVYQNLIIGAIAKQSALVSQLQLISQNKSSQDALSIIQTYTDNLNYLEKIQLLGSPPFTFTYKTDSIQQTTLTSQYISTVINYATTLQNNLNTATNPQQVSDALKNTDPYTISSLLTGVVVKDTLISAFNQRKAEIYSILNAGKTQSIIVVSIGVILIASVGIFIILWVRNLSLQKLRVLQIFLQISDPQIQYFSSITERFLLSIHSDETAQLEQDIENAKKTFSSTFAKKKSFKLITFNKALFFKLAFIPLLMTAFFFHTYVISYSNSDFQVRSIDYFAFTAQGDFYLSSGLLNLSISQNQNRKIEPFYISQNIRLYYRNYLEKDQVSFGLYPNFHTTFGAIMLQDICTGSLTPYGWVSINDSCSLPSLYPNGTFLILSSALTQIQNWNQSSPLPSDFHIKMQILSQAQKILSEKLLLAQQQLSDSVAGSILSAFLLWTGVVFVCGIVMWGMTAISFVRELNQVKSILGMLPLSLVKETPLASRYINRILKQKKKC